MCIQTRRRLTWSYVGLLVTAIAFGVPQRASADIVHPDDVIIQFSLAVGNDAVNGENFGFDTLRLKENNLRIHFDDTSTSASFPKNDWRIIINDSSNGGGSYFAVEDSTAGRQVFRVEAGARTNALYVEDDGDIGIGTNVPAVDIDIKTGNTPTVRLQQDGTSGFTPQSWDLAGNETNFFIRDVTNGSTLPFRVRPSTPSSSLDLFADKVVVNDGSNDYDTRIESNGQTHMVFVDAGTDRVGIGTETPASVLHVTSQAANSVTIDRNSAAGGAGNAIQLRGLAAAAGAFVTYGEISSTIVTPNTSASLSFNTRSGAAVASRIFIDDAGEIGIGDTTPSHPIDVGTANGAHVTAGGAWTNGSSREFKENIEEVATPEAHDTVMNLKPVKFNYKKEPGEQYAGFIAEDVPELVATNSRKYLTAMDIVSVVTKVVQDQQETIERQQETISTLSKRVEQLEAQD